MEHATLIKATAPSACPSPNVNLLACWRSSRPQHATNTSTQYTVLKLYGSFFMCCLLGSMVACLLVRCTSRECSHDMVHYNCLDSLTARLTKTTALCTIAHLYHYLYQGVSGWFCCLALELELANAGAVHPADFPHGWALVPVPVTAQHLALQAPTSLQAKKRSWSSL
jgi:hypothetical protein